VSLILDALARAERDKRRRADPVPDLLTPTTPASAKPVFPRVLVLGLALVVVPPGAWWILARGNPDATSASGQVAAALPLATVARSAAGQPGTVQAAAPVASRDEAAVPKPLSTDGQVAREAARDETRDGSPGADGGPGAALPSNGDVDPAVEALYAAGADVDRAAPPGDASVQGSLPQPPPRSASPSATAAVGRPEAPDGTPEAASAGGGESPGEERVDIEALLRAVRAEAAAAELLPHPAPLLASLTRRFRDAVPTLMYLRHDFNAAGDSTVLINGETLRVGARTRGVEIREILPDSVILRYEEQDFRLKALNSWVNL
jgi:hypothetical protein